MARKAVTKAVRTRGGTAKARARARSLVSIPRLQEQVRQARADHQNVAVALHRMVKERNALRGANANRVSKLKVSRDLDRATRMLQRVTGERDDLKAALVPLAAVLAPMLGIGELLERIEDLEARDGI